MPTTTTPQVRFRSVDGLRIRYAESDGSHEFLDARLPNSRLVVIDAGHFVWEEAPMEYASIVLDSTQGGRTAS
jgi:pimeloyl-ACP methyl ester carboxylesterase